MGFYDRHLLPHLLDMACSQRAIAEQRAKVVPQARGRVLEIGMGSGLNLPHYDRDEIEVVWGLEPSAGMRKKARKNVARAPFDFRWLDLPSETIPLDDRCIDTVVLTFTLCTIPDWRKALGEMRRVLATGGKIVFCEHGRAPDSTTRRWQKRINPLWQKAVGGCHLNRPIPHFLEEAGFTIEELETGYVAGPKIASYHYRGTAR